ncbi:MAG: acetate/propionate family kinase [Armatimonadota bacterium]
MKILVANAGSTSFKCRVLDMPSEHEIATAKVERVGEPVSTVDCCTALGKTVHMEVPLPDHGAAMNCVIDWFTGPEAGVLSSAAELAAVGFKPVYAKGITGCQLMDDRVLDAMAEYSNILAPQHNPIYIKVIKSCRQAFTTIPMVGLFEDFLFDSLPEHATIYPIPWDWTEKYGIRKHLFHGASHKYVTMRVAELLDRDLIDLNIIACHLGGSSTIMAFRNGVCIDGTGGFSLQNGVPLSTRSSDMDPYIIPYLVSKGEGTLEQVVYRMAHEGGVAAISGMGCDFRDLERAAADGHKRAGLALDAYVHGVRRYLGAYLAELGHTDVVTIAGGVGESGAGIRSRIFHGLQELGIVLDEEMNAGCCRNEGKISADESRIQIWVVPTNEELIVARETYRLLNGLAAASHETQ